MQHLSGAWRADAGVSPVPTPAGQVGGAVPAEDSQAALRHSESRYRRLFEAAQDGILLLNAQTAQIEDANPYLITMLGYSHAEMLGKKLWEVGAFADADKTAAMFAQLQATGYARYDDLPLKTRQGQLISVEFVSNAYDCEGRRVIQCNVRNTTPQRQAEEQVRKLSLVVAQSAERIVIASLLDDRIEYVNEAQLRHSGCRRDQLIGRSYLSPQADAATQQAHGRMRAALGLGQPWQGEVCSQRQDGSECTEQVSAAPIRQADGSASHFVTFSIDITQRQRDAEELARHRHQLEALVDIRTLELAAATQAAQAASVAKSAFLANMSHEIRSPLVGITGATYLLKHSGVTPQQAEWVAVLEASGRHLLELINAVRDLSKIEAGKLVLDKAPVNVAVVLANVAALLSARATAKHLTLRVDAQDMPPTLLGDATRLKQALLNYADNAIKFTEQGGITLRVRCEQDSADSILLRFEVQDTGMGIASEALPRLFGAFEQADNSSTRRHGGTGLGLAIVRQLAQLMGGEVGLSSAPGLGSCFWFTARLGKIPSPLTAAPAPAQAAAAAALLQTPAADPRILLVEDDDTNRMVLLQLLQSVSTRVDLAEDGVEALACAVAHAYDLILMDVHMPRMDGLEATRRIRQLPGGQNTPIIGLTASAFEEDRAACLAAGMDDFQAKPFPPEALFEKMARWLAGKTRHLPPGS